MVNLVLFEHASGYGLFKVKEFEEVEALSKQVQESMQVRPAHEGGRKGNTWTPTLMILNAIFTHHVYCI